MSDAPHLRRLMDGYFHQDHDLGGDDVAVLAEFARTVGSDEVAAVVAEIDDQLAEPVAGLLDRFRRRTGEWNMMIGDGDAAAREWLLSAREVLLDARALPTPLSARTPPPQPLVDRLRKAIWGASVQVDPTPCPALADLAHRFLARRDVYPTQAAALADFCRTAWPEAIARAVDEADAFLALSEVDARQRWTSFAPDVPVADDVAAVRLVEHLRTVLWTALQGEA